MNEPKRVREPVQVYMAADDRALLDEVAESLGVSRAEALRRGVRRLAADLDSAAAPGSSLQALRGALDGGDDVPPDLSVRHDEYLYDRAEGA